MIKQQEYFIKEILNTFYWEKGAGSRNIVDYSDGVFVPGFELKICKRVGRMHGTFIIVDRGVEYFIGKKELGLVIL